MKVPETFMEFLTNAISWAHEYEVRNPKYENSNDPHYNLILFIENTVLPWYKGGPDVISNIAKGLEEIYDFSGHENHYDIMASLLRAFGNDMDNGVHTNAVHKEYMNGINTLFHIGYCFYELELSKEGKVT